MCRYFSNASILIFHRIFITFSSVGRATSRKVIFHLFYIVRCMWIIACCYMWFFYIVHHFFILRLISAFSCVICYSSSFLHRKFVLCSFCSFCCIVHLLFIVVLKCMNFSVFSMLFGYNVSGGCIFHVWGKFLLILRCFEVFSSCILALYGYNRLSCFWICMNFVVHVFWSSSSWFEFVNYGTSLHVFLFRVLVTAACVAVEDNFTQQWYW